MSEKQPLKWIFLNAAYTFIILGLSLAAAMVAKLILNLFLPIDLSSTFLVDNPSLESSLCILMGLHPVCLAVC